MNEQCSTTIAIAKIAKAVVPQGCSATAAAVAAKCKSLFINMLGRVKS